MKKYYVLLAMVFSFFIIAGCNKTIDSSSIAEKSYEYIVCEESIETPYINVKLPESYFKSLSYCIDDEDIYTITFYDTETKIKLYSMYFDSLKGDYLGTITNNDKIINISVKMEPLSDSDKKYQVFVDYQNDINYIIEKFQLENNFIIQENIGYLETFDIKTSVATFKYPIIYKEKVDIKVSDENVAFSYKNVPLFDLCFKKCDGVLLGSYNGTEIYFVEHEITTDEQAEMVGAVNVILDNLNEDKNFVSD